MKQDKILIVDDEALNRILLEGILEVLGYESCSAANGTEALSMLSDQIDLVLLDVNMPVLSGFDVVKQIRLAPTCSDVPVVMVTALSSMQDRLAAVEAGANDFICKPVDQTELRIRVASQLRVKHAQDAVKRHQQNLEVQVSERTLSLQEANERLARLATTDPLTGLANHRSLMDTLDEEIERCRETRLNCSVLFIDLDHFKALNDSCGHVVGDSLLQEVAAILVESVGESGFCGRWGGEEFVCILPDKDGQGAIGHAEDIRRTIAQHAFRAGMGYHITCSIGVASFPGDGLDRSTLAEAADKAMYVAKSLGRNQVRAADDVSSGFEGFRSDASSREDQALTCLVEALASLVNLRDGSTGSHINDVEELSMQLAHAMGLTDSETRIVGITGKLHDIGKVAIPDVILTKAGSLTAEEWEIMKQHSVIGAEVVARVPSLRAMAPGVRAHHERWDGGGYPDGLAGSHIPLAAQIVSVADAYCAITANRPYRTARSHEIALAELRRCEGTQFAPDVIEALNKVFDEASSKQAA